MAKSYGPRPTAQNIRDQAGVGSVINTHHEGPSNTRTTENRRNLDDLTSSDLGKSKRKESPMNNPDYGSGGEKKG